MSHVKNEIDAKPPRWYRGDDDAEEKYPHPAKQQQQQPPADEYRGILSLRELSAALPTGASTTTTTTTLRTERDPTRCRLHAFVHLLAGVLRCDDAADVFDAYAGVPSDSAADDDAFDRYVLLRLRRGQWGVSLALFRLGDQAHLRPIIGDQQWRTRFLALVEALLMPCLRTRDEGMRRLDERGLLHWFFTREELPTTTPDVEPAPFQYDAPSTIGAEDGALRQARFESLLADAFRDVRTTVDHREWLLCTALLRIAKEARHPTTTRLLTRFQHSAVQLVQLMLALEWCSGSVQPVEKSGGYTYQVPRSVAERWERVRDCATQWLRHYMRHGCACTW